MANAKPAKNQGRRSTDKPKDSPVINDNQGSGGATPKDTWPADGGRWR